MIRLLYLSQAAPGISDEQVQGILRSSQPNNAARGITGALVYGGGLFMQLLEGPEANVLRGYIRLIDDNRHGGCKIVHISPANERVFQNWSMGIIRSDPFRVGESCTRIRSAPIDRMPVTARSRARRSSCHQAGAATSTVTLVSAHKSVSGAA